MDHACCVTTAPREDGISYVGESVKSIRDAGFTNICASSEPEGPHRDADFDSVWVNTDRLGSWKNMLTAIDFCLSQFTFADFVFYFQDDIEVAKGSCEYMMSTWAKVMYERKYIAYMYTPQYLERANQTDEEWFKAEYRKSGGSLGVMMPRRFAEEITQNPIDWQKMTMCDHALGAQCEARKWDLYRPMTSVVQHLGVVSAIAGKKAKMNQWRMAANFTTDARSIDC